MKVISKHQSGSLLFLQGILVVLPRAITANTDFYEISWTSNVKEALQLNDEQAKAVAAFIANLNLYSTALIVSHPHR